MPDRPPTPLPEVVEYLREIGYGDFYAPASAAAGEICEAPDASRPPVQSGSAPATGDDEAPPSPRATAGTDELARLATEAEVCRACRLCETRNRVVFGSGDPHAELMFIGEGPGAEEDRQGLPFVGRAGELLTKIIQALDLRRDHVYIANVVKCRPPGNRDPQPDEVAACRHFLAGQICSIQPRILVALGRIAAQTLLGSDEPIGRMRGKWYELFGVPMMVTYHPAALLRNPSLKRPTWEDMQQVRDRLRGS